MVAAIEAENDHARPRILACLERFKVCKAEDDIAAAGWMLAALQKRIDERDLADWEKLKVVADGTAQLLLNPRNKLQ
ncbi:hypothetical protein ACDY96_34595 [Rhizobium mongolense]|uniref:hypothetical protein n=1 Tax=Rhizobium mongolense TaxID=57676 RepID=UPI003557389E